MNITDAIFAVFAKRGHAAYFGESVSQLEHALQTARLAERSHGRPALVVAALLHDIGHLLHNLPEDIADRGIDGHHENAGAAWLARHFGPAVTEPVRLHVDAKRYLCRSDEYLTHLSASSLQSLALQGGAFNDAEASLFEANPWSRGALLLRRWDDEAKVSGLLVPELEHYRSAIEAVANSQIAGGR
jgi:[1-hydroxy-2-(trimethylamino)ethyl]phosphonate dioxygenase